MEYPHASAHHRTRFWIRRLGQELKDQWKWKLIFMAVIALVTAAFCGAIR